MIRFGYFVQHTILFSFPFKSLLPTHLVHRIFFLKKNLDFVLGISRQVSCVIVVGALHGFYKRHGDTLVSADVQVDGINGAGNGLPIPLVRSNLNGLVTRLVVVGIDNIAGT